MRIKQPQQQGFALAMLMTVTAMSMLLAVIVMVQIEQVNRLQTARVTLNKDIGELGLALQRFYLAECKTGSVSQAGDLVGRYIGSELRFAYGDEYRLSVSIEAGRPMATVALTLAPDYIHLAKLAMAAGAELNGSELSRKMPLSWAGNAFEHVLLNDAKTTGGVAC